MPEEHEKGRDAFEDDKAYRLHCLRHSTAHVMAQAVLRLHPEAKLAIGPAIEDGFYYDIDLDTSLTPDHLRSIEKEMKRIVKENQRFEQDNLSPEQARERFADQPFKLELIEQFAGGGEPISIYRNPQKKDGPEFYDLCRGPHVMRTGQCKHFKLLRISGAYWRADASNAQLQRIYGTVWPTRAELDQHMYRLEEARKRDHRRVGTAMKLFMFHEHAPGAAFWLPRGEDVYHNLSERMRGLLAGNGYQVVRTPLLFDSELWKTSGHWEHYQDDMFILSEGEEGGRTLGLKPMNCPCHMLIFKSSHHSYRDLPVRLHDQGVLHRDELSGTLSGLTRVRQFAQDDAHIFCAEEQIADEVSALLSLIARVYAAFDLELRVHLSTRPEDKLGEDALWDQAEAALQEAIERQGQEYDLRSGDGAFYGPKIDFDVLDALGRTHQCATIQLDFQLPRRFDLSYVGADNRPHVPVVIHRAIFGSFERFIALLIEHYSGNFPAWLAPEAVRVMTVSDKSLAHGQRVLAALHEAGIKATFDDSDNKIGYKIRRCHGMRVPYMAIIGEREQERGTVSLRSRDEGDLGAVELESLLHRLAAEVKPPF